MFDRSLKPRVPVINCYNDVEVFIAQLVAPFEVLDGLGNIRGEHCFSLSVILVFDETLSDLFRSGYSIGKMQDQSDAQLLREYARDGIEAAFAVLVRRYTDLVHSVAMRQTGSQDVAADVSQTVFISLVRAAPRLSTSLAQDASIAGWLCRAARNQCLKRQRDDFRRVSREIQAMDPMISSPEPAADWGQLRPILDEVMSELNEADHDTVVMRFFNNQDLRTIGLALGISEDSAQKRVARALDKLRVLLRRRGLGTTGAALSSVLSANAVQAAPAGLIATICASLPSAVPVAAGTSVLTATKTVVMTTLHKTLIATTLIAIGVGIYKAREAADLRKENERLHAEQVRSATSHNSTTAMAWRHEEKQGREDAIRGPVPQSDVPPASAPHDSRLAAASQALGDRAIKVRERLDKTPGKQIPELKLLTDADWLDALKDIDRLSTEEDFRRAYHQLRQQAKSKFSDLLERALKAYVQASQGNLPSQLSQLKPFFNTPIDDTILQRYGMLYTGKFQDVPRGEYLVAETAQPVDDLYDTVFEINLNGRRTRNFSQLAAEGAIANYVEANQGRLPSSASQVLPFARQPVDVLKVQQLIDRIPRGITTIDQLNGLTQTK